MLSVPFLGAKCGREPKPVAPPSKQPFDIKYTYVCKCISFKLQPTENEVISSFWLGSSVQRQTQEILVLGEQTTSVAQPAPLGTLQGYSYTAPVWMGEFGQMVRGNYWLNMLRCSTWGGFGWVTGGVKTCYGLRWF